MLAWVWRYNVYKKFIGLYYELSIQLKKWSYKYAIVDFSAIIQFRPKYS